MGKSKLHPIAAKHGFKSNEEFYEVFPDQESYEMAMGGQYMEEGGAMSAFNRGVPNFLNLPIIKQGGMPCMNCGGAIPTYQNAGTVIPGYDPAKGTHMLAAGQQSLTPAQLTTSGYTQSPTNPNWYNEGTGRFYKTFSPGQPGYTPFTPNVPAKQINELYPSYKVDPTTGGYDTSITNPVQQVNSGITSKVRPVLGKNQKGGFMTEELQGTYPMFNIGGGSMYENVNTGYYAYGGDPSIPTLTEFRNMVTPSKKEGGPSYPGETETSIIDKNKKSFMDFLSNNVEEDMVKNMYKEITGPQFAGGGSNTAPTFWQMLAGAYAPPQMQYSENIPLNFTRGYSLGNKDYSRLQDLTENSKYKGVSKVNYGPMARLLGRTGRRLFGPSSIEFDVDTPYEDRMQMNPNAGALIQYEQMQRAAQNQANAKTTPAAKQITPTIDPNYIKPGEVTPTTRQQQILDMGNFWSPVNQSQDTSGIGPGYEYTDKPFNANQVGPRTDGSPSYFQKLGGLPWAQTGNNPVEYGPYGWQNNSMPVENLQTKNSFGLFNDYANQGLKESMAEQEHLLDPDSGKMYDRERFKIKRRMLPPPGEETARLAITGMEGARSFLDGIRDRKQETIAKNTVKTGDYLNPLEQDPTRGNHNQFGILRPDDYTPVQFQGQNFNPNQYGSFPMKGGGEIVPNFWNATQLNWPLQMNKLSTPDTEVHSTLKAVPRYEANLEAEGGETAIVNQGGIPAHFKINGPRHTNGGVPLNLPENSFIFSDTKAMKIKDPIILAQFGMAIKKGGYTPAEIAKKYDLNKYRQILADPDTTSLQRKTAEMMIANMNLKLAKLGLAQESKKGFPQGIPAIAMPYIESMNINPADMVNTQAQPEQPFADNMARFGGNLHRAQEGETVPYVQGKPTKTSTYEPFGPGENWVKFDQPITMPDGDVLYELPQSEWNKFQQQGYLDVAGAPFSRGTFRDVANNPWGGDFKPGNSPKQYRIETKAPGKKVDLPKEVPVGTTYKEGNKTYKVIATDRYEDGAPAYRVQEISDPDRNISSFFSSYAGNKVVPAQEVKNIVESRAQGIKDKAYEKEMAEWKKRTDAKGKSTGAAANVQKPVDPDNLGFNDVATTPTTTVAPKQEAKTTTAAKKKSMHINELSPEEKLLLGIK